MRLRCPECREPAHVEAKVCPHCGSHFTPDQLRDRFRGAQYRGLLLIAIVALIIWAATRP